MTKKDFTLISNFDGWELKGVVLEPKNSPKGIIQLVHGMTEHKYRYRDLMQFFVEKGYIFIAHDHRGHGESAHTQEDLGWFQDDTSRAIVEDAVQVTEYARKLYPNLPLTLYGHSMGSMVVRCYLREHDERIDKLVVSGSPTLNPLVDGGILLTKLITKLYGPRHRSKMLRYLSTGKGDQLMKGKGGGSWLTKDAQSVLDSKNDPKCDYTFTCNGFMNLFLLMKYTYQKEGYQVKNPKLPIYFISGADDAVIETKKKWWQALEFLRELGYQNVSGKLYEGLRHEIHNELEKEMVFEDVLKFIEEDVHSNV